MLCRITDGPNDPDQYEDWLKDLDRAQAEEDFDPTPWCHICGAMDEDKCECGPYAENH